LEAHDRLEELVFYPALKAIPKAAGFAEKHAEAHEGMEQAMSQLDGLPMDDVDWAPIFRSMQDHLLKHVVDEESHLFAKLRKLLSPQELDALSERMHAAIPPLPLPA
jgi:hemerythrin superfamily protein